MGANETARENAWAKPVSRFRVTNLPPGAVSINVEGRQITGPLQGFGQMWHKTYLVRLPGITQTPAQVMGIWKREFASFQPAASRFYPPMTGIEPGQLIFVNLDLPIAPGLPSLIPVSSGVMVLFSDDEMFTVTTPEGFPVSGWNTFSVYEQDGCVVAQVESLDRATDPIYEFGTLFMGGGARQEENWIHVLKQLSARLHVEGQVQMIKALVDPRWQWREAKNVWRNAAIRTFLYRSIAPLRWIGRQRGNRNNR